MIKQYKIEKENKSDSFGTYICKTDAMSADEKAKDGSFNVVFVKAVYDYYLCVCRFNLI